jgi:Icc-related predicted phosphoesterase
MRFIFATDIHGNDRTYHSIFLAAEEEKVDAVVLGGDILPMPLTITGFTADQQTFITSVLRPMLEGFHKRSGCEVYLMPGNDDAASCADELESLERDGFAKYMNMRRHSFGDLYIFGYSFVPLTPFGIKDWDKFDTPNQAPPITHYPPFFTRAHGIENADYDDDIRPRGTIEDDFKKIAAETDPSKTVYVTHSPPYNTALDIVYNGEHVGSRSIRRFIEKYCPPLTLHGHIHESPSRSGKVFDVIGNTVAVNPGSSCAAVNALVIDTEDVPGSFRKLGG